MKRKPHNAGLSLVELMVVIVVICILIVATGFSYQGWMGKYSVESEIRELYGDLVNARTRAMQRARSHFVTFPGTTSYTIYEDDSDGTKKVPDGNETLQTPPAPVPDTQLTGFPRSVKYPITWGGGNITFDERGLVSSNGIEASSPPRDTIRIDTTASKLDADYDCVLLEPTKISQGKWGTCGNTCCVK